MRTLVAATVALLFAASPASAAPYIQAHRGGSVINGAPRFPENTMPAFRHAARRGFVLEMDTKLTSDGVPIVIHDDSLDRTTTCTGPVNAKTAAQIVSGCKADVLGSPGSGLPTKPIPAGKWVKLSRLSRVLGFARRRGAQVSLEIKNIPTDGDFDTSPDFANKVMDVVVASGIPTSQLIIQSFWPPNLDVAKQRLPGVETSLLSLSQTNEGAPADAHTSGYDWVSGQWPVSAAHIANAHNFGERVVPYTLDTRADVRDAVNAGVDALITNDPAMARRVVARTAPSRPRIPPPPSPGRCAKLDANHSLPTIKAFDPKPGAPRIFAMQPKQEVRHVVTYRTFRAKIECMIRERVLPHLAKGRPNVVAFNEVIGVATIATGSRGQAARDIFAQPDFPSCQNQGAPCATLAALEAVHSSYAPQVAVYHNRFPGMSPITDSFVAATDTFARGWMQTFSDMARRYHVYILGSNFQAPFRESTDPAELAELSDPDLCPTPGASSCPKSVYVAVSPNVYNEVFMWGPKNARHEGPWPLRNVVAHNKKVPLTPLEAQLQLVPGPSTGPDAALNLRPYRIPGTKGRIGFATSAPAFVYGDLPPGTDPCSDTSLYYMRCLDKLRTNLVMQDEANDGTWAANGGGGYWQPLEWMASTYRAAIDPAVHFTYNVTPMLVGNLADLPFDGQSAITQRGLRPTNGNGCNYVGNGSLQTQAPESDPPSTAHYIGPKKRFLAIAPWRFRHHSRARLRTDGAKLGPSSDDPAIENDYLETAIAADLPFPADPRRRGCAGVRSRR